MFMTELIKKGWVIYLTDNSTYGKDRSATVVVYSSNNQQNAVQCVSYIDAIDFILKNDLPEVVYMLVKDKRWGN